MATGVEMNIALRETQSPTENVHLIGEVRFVMNLQWFREWGLVFLKSFVQTQQSLELRFTR
jgi:hypothetical protein